MSVMLLAGLLLTGPATLQSPGAASFEEQVYEGVRREVPVIDDQNIVLPVDPRHTPPSVTAEWLQGHWVSSPAQCYGGDFGLGIHPDGRFTDYWFSGHYRVESGRLIRVVEELTDAAEPGDRVGTRIEQEVATQGPNQIVLGSGAASERLYRCPANGMPG